MTKYPLTRAVMIRCTARCMNAEEQADHVRRMLVEAEAKAIVAEAPGVDPQHADNLLQTAEVLLQTAFDETQGWRRRWRPRDPDVIRALWASMSPPTEEQRREGIKHLVDVLEEAGAHDRAAELRRKLNDG